MLYLGVSADRGKILCRNIKLLGIQQLAENLGHGRETALLRVYCRCIVGTSRNLFLTVFGGVVKTERSLFVLAIIIERLF